MKVGDRAQVDRYSGFGSEHPTGTLVGEVIEVTEDSVTVRGNGQTLVVPADADDLDVIDD